MPRLAVTDWPQSRLTKLLGTRYPIVQAPMAGGPSTTRLVVAVSEAGGLGSIAGALLAPNELRAAIRAVREQTARPFAVNVFAPPPPVDADAKAVEMVRGELAQHRRRLGLTEAAPPPPQDWTVDDQLAVVVEERVPVLSFTFGIPPLDGLTDQVLIGTATTPTEAVALEHAGVDVIVAQGAEAGGHRGTFIGSFTDGLIGIVALVPQTVDAVSAPVIASGGIVDGRGIAAALTLGAEGVQLGTAFLFCTESGASPAWRRALRTLPTVVNDAYTGRPARGALTPFVAELAAGPPPAPYAVQRALTADFKSVDGYGWYLGGQGADLARELPAAEVVATLVAETTTALARATQAHTRSSMR
ncbi:MAG: nitronate monooxygenase [Candidatus Dormibacter sp.]